MFAYQCAYRWERIVLSNQSYRIRISFASEKRHIARYIHACGTHRHARNRLCLVAYSVGTGMVQNMGLKVLPVSFQPSEYHVCGFGTDGTVRRNTDGLRCSFQKFQLVHFRFIVNINDIVDDMLQLAKSDTARHTFTAALRMTKSQERSRQVNRALSRRACDDSSLQIFVKTFHGLLSSIV